MEQKNNFSENLNQIVLNITKMERKNKESDPKFQAWIEQICDPQSELNLVPNLLTFFLDEMTKQDEKEKILKLLVKLMMLQEESITEQLLSNKNFPKVVVNYITLEDKTKMSDSAFYLLTKLFKEENFKEFINVKFIEALFDGLTVVHEEDLLIAIVSVLVEINSNYKDQDDNIFLQVHKTSSNSRVLDELLLRLLNNETSKERILKILLCLNKLMISEDSPIFYESDLESLIDIIINKLQSTYTENIKLFFMQMLAKITSYEAYYHNKYKDEEIDELMNDFLEREDQSAEVKKFSQEVVDNITNH